MGDRSRTRWGRPIATLKGTTRTELDRPDQAKMRPADPGGFREAWDILERCGARSCLGLFLGGDQGGGGFADVPDQGADCGFDAEAADGGFQGEVVAAEAVQVGGDFG